MIYRPKPLDGVLRDGGVDGAGMKNALRTIAAAALAETWRDIGEAPKDRLIDILIDGKTRWCDCYYDVICNEWRTSRPGGHLISINARHVTHWREPPAPPPKPEDV